MPERPNICCTRKPSALEWEAGFALTQATAASACRSAGGG